MVLLFAKVIGVYWWGILSAITMAVGTSLTISLLALLVHYARRLAVYLSRNRAPAAWGSIACSTLALSGGIILLFAGVLLYLSSQPAVMGGIRLLGR
jgi:ABC-type nickel/cobalt efflux system permease component RcnA